ncbi:MAG: bifunctional 5,10-methylenetetrahydrofolate dehydrogenase/5,10-methenyltetrahydrofolate cyclohydrolase [Candidatus Omnitrophica bacterium]|nr:bifunctional 5,10-methylenetetrahydrofolate dehydrogenase/5,10-methenyltetrahydrofolate cyclohydrolase [Candidatus Omnitrophota bacterium]
MAKILDGKKIAGELKKILRDEAADLKNKSGSEIILASVVIGSDAGAKIYASAQQKLCEEMGIGYIRKDMPAGVALKEIIKCFIGLTQQKATGIIVNQPLPADIDYTDVIECLSPALDVECIHPANFGKFYSGYKGFAPCTASAVMELLKYTKTDLLNKEIVIIGYSRIVGKPLALMLDERATITTCHVGTAEDSLKRHINNADVLISAVGKEGFNIPGEWIKKGAIVIDVATRRSGSSITGDIDFKAAQSSASFITPVPGGVGPITNVMLIRNLLYLYKEQRKKI